jgi:hypothetical protein
MLEFCCGNNPKGLFSTFEIKMNSSYLFFDKRKQNQLEGTDVQFRAIPSGFVLRQSLWFLSATDYCCKNNLALV